MSKWKIIGANQQSGADVVAIVSAASEKAAGIAASELGIAVSAINRMPGVWATAALRYLPLAFSALAIVVACCAYLYSGPPRYGAHPSTPEDFAYAEFSHALDAIRWSKKPAWAMSGGKDFVGFSSAKDSFRIVETARAGNYTVVFYDYKLKGGLEKEYTVLVENDGRYWLAEDQYISKYDDEPFPGAPASEAAKLKEKIVEWND